MTLDSQSMTLSPLPDVLSHGLVAVSTFGLLSFFCSTSLLSYLTWRLITWRVKSGPDNPPNQFLLLIYCLLLADIQQALAFLLNINALRNNAILVGTSTCFAQGWFVSTGDLASSVFICAIAVHSWMGVVKEYRLPTRTFYCCLVVLWLFVYVMAMLGPILHGYDFYVRADAWCWINHNFQIERLWLHYFWIFCAMFSTVLIYAYIVFFLRRKSLSTDDISMSPSLHGATPLMILYPLIYIFCTAPLAAGRIYALAGHDVSLGYFCAAGTLIACNGWLDVILYASTRADIVFSEYPPGEETGLETFAFMGKGHKLGTTTTIQAGAGSAPHSRSASLGANRLGKSRGRVSSSGDSVENLYALGGIAIKGEVTVSVDTEQHNLVRQDRVGMTESANRNQPFRSRSQRSHQSRSSSMRSFSETENS